MMKNRVFKRLAQILGGKHPKNVEKTAIGRVQLGLCFSSIKIYIYNIKVVTWMDLLNKTSKME